VTQFWEERRLWCDVILQAWHDYFSVAANITTEQRVEAALFLTALDGDWATSRRDICVAAGIDPDLLRERALMGRLGMKCEANTFGNALPPKEHSHG
jgi:hypothetical protein